MSIWEFEDLARHICSIDLDDEEIELDDILMENFNMDFCEFAEVMERVLPLCMVAKSELTGNLYCGFASNGLWLAKMEIK